MYIFFMIWLSSGLPLTRKAINVFIYGKHDALRSMKQGSYIDHASLKQLYLKWVYKPGYIKSLHFRPGQSKVAVVCMMSVRNQAVRVFK